jgi:Calcineurin-like phosphoesterase
MKHFRPHTFLLSAFFIAVWVCATPAPVATDAPSKLIAIGDIHGGYDEFVGDLHRVGLLDDAGNWNGGTTTLVQTGDFLDRGEKVREVMDLLMALEPQAKAAGGRVEVLLGNHEAMNLIGEMRDVNPRAYDRFTDPESEARRSKAWEQYQALAKIRAAEIMSSGDRQIAVPPVYQPPPKEEWMAAHPPGAIEYLDALGPDGKYGRWLRQRHATVMIGDTIFVHGGFNPDFAPKKLDDVNEQVQHEVERFDNARRALGDRKAALPFFRFQEVLDAAQATIEVARAQTSAGDSVTISPVLATFGDLMRIGTWSLINPNGPLWYRGFATLSGEEGRSLVDKVAGRYKARRFVVGHTMPASMRITPRFSQRVFLIDTGMLSSVYKGGRASALEIQGDNVTAIYADGQVALAGAAATAAPSYD